MLKKLSPALKGGFLFYTNREHLPNPSSKRGFHFLQLRCNFHVSVPFFEEVFSKSFPPSLKGGFFHKSVPLFEEGLGEMFHKSNNAHLQRLEEIFPNSFC